MKLISYKYSFSGDCGFRPSNGAEWNCNEEHLYFDAEKWTMKKIYNAAKMLYRKYISFGSTSTFSEVLDNMRNAIIPFVNESDGVYMSRKDSWKDIKEEKRIDPKIHEVISWELNGETHNHGYDKIYGKNKILKALDSFHPQLYIASKFNPAECRHFEKIFTGIINNAWDFDEEDKTNLELVKSKFEFEKQNSFQNDSDIVSLIDKFMKEYLNKIIIY